MAVSKRLRYEILRRDNHACRYCGGTAPDVTLTVDHVVPVALGGSDDPTNLVAACRDCNAGKSASAPDSPIVANVAADAIRWADAMKRAAHLAQRLVDERIDFYDRFAAEWDSWTFTGMNFIAPVPEDYTDSLDRLLDAGLTEADLINFAAMALRKSGTDRSERWAYFCGIGWRTLERRQEVARQLLAAEDG